MQPIRICLPMLWLFALLWTPARAVASGSIAPEAECVDCPLLIYGLGDRSLRLDSQSRPHVAFTRDYVYYARLEETGWQVEILGRAPEPIYSDSFVAPASLALDANDVPHVAYLSPDNTELLYAVKTTQGWRVETVDSAAPGERLNYETTLELDSRGRAHIVYGNYGDLKYARRDADGWAVQTVDTEGWAEQYISLALDAADRPHAVYFSLDYSGYGARLKYAWLSGADWQIEFIDEAEWLGEYNSLALDSLGQPHVSYPDITHGVVKYAHRGADGRWVGEVLDSFQWFGGFTSIAVDHQDQPHVAYESRGSLLYAIKTKAGWSRQVAGRHPRYVALALDARDRPHIATQSYEPRGLAYLNLTEGGWTRDLPDRIPDVGRYGSLAARADGSLAIGYYDSNRGDLRYATRESGGWVVSVVDATGDVGSHASLALDAAGRPHLSYYDVTNGDLKYATFDVSVWKIAVVDAAGDVGLYSSLALDAAGHPIIACYDAGAGDLKLATWTGAGWAVEVVDSVGNVGQYASLALDAGGRPHIAYYDATLGDLRYAVREAAGWVVTVVDAAGNVGQHASLALDAAGRPQMAYYDITHGDLKHAAWDGRWQSAVVDAVGDVGAFASLALTPAGEPVISYAMLGAGRTPGELRLARRTDGRWRTSRLLGGWNQGGHTTLALESDGDAWIGYYDGDCRWLRMRWAAPYTLFLPIAGRQGSLVTPRGTLPLVPDQGGRSTSLATRMRRFTERTP